MLRIRAVHVVPTALLGVLMLVQLDGVATITAITPAVTADHDDNNGDDAGRIRRGDGEAPLLNHRASLLYPGIEKREDCDVALALYMVHLRKAGGRTIRTTFTANCALPAFLRSVPASFGPDIVASTSHGHQAEEEVRTAYLEAKVVNIGKAVTLLATIVRNPVARVISAFSTSVGRKDMRRKELLPDCAVVGHTHVCGEAIAAMHAGTMTLEQFATSPDTEPAMNYQVQHLSNKYGRLSTLRKSEQHAILRRSTRALDHMDAVLITERFNESIAVLACRVEQHNGPRLRHVHLCSNWNPHPSPREVTPKVQALLEKRNSLDMELYNHALQRFEEHVRELKNKPCFKRVVRGLRECPSRSWYQHKRKGDLWSRNSSRAKAMLSAHASTSMLKLTSCPLSEE